MIAVALSLLFLRPASAVEMDFELYNNLIHVPIEVSGHKATAVIDTGAGSAVMDLALADKWNLPESGDISVGGIGNEPVRGHFLTGVMASIGGIKTPIPLAIPLGSLAKLSGRPLEIVLGYEFLKTHILDVDYPHRHLRILDTDANLAPGGVSVPIHFVSNHIHLTSEMTVNGQNYSLETVIDTGATSCGGLTSKFLKQHSINAQMTPKTVIGGGVGGTVEGRFFRPDSIKIADTTLSGPVMSLSDSPGGASGANSPYDLLVGGEILKRFRITIDYPHQRLIFQPGGEIGSPFEADKTGLRMLAEGVDLHTFRVAGILPGSSAAAAGLKIDDVIESVGGRAALTFTLVGLRETFRSGTAKAWDLGIARGDHT